MLLRCLKNQILVSPVVETKMFSAMFVEIILSFMEARKYKNNKNYLLLLLFNYGMQSRK